MSLQKYRALKDNPSLLLVLLFTVAISIGSILLKLPVSTVTPISWIDAVFTSTSAMTVTGLTVVDTGVHFTFFGQIIILLLIKIGGLGIMTFACIIFVALGKKIGMKERILIQQSLNLNSFGGIISLVKNLVIFTSVVELIGIILLSIRWVPEFGLAKGVYYSLFHSIASFNNAGFSIWSDNLMGYVGDSTINIVVSLLIMIGGIGFTVIAEIFKKKSLKSLSLHSRLMIFGTIIITILGTVFLFLIEFNNPKTLAALAIGDKWWAAYFQTVTTRTAGFNSIDISGLNETSILLMMFFMFVGAGSTSTGGGIKLTTFIVMMLAVYKFLKGRKYIVLRERTIRNQIVFKSLAIITISSLWILLAVFLLSITESRPIVPLLFETVSAFGTVGLSMGVTAHLSILGKLIIIATMAFGKLGPLTLLFAITRTEQLIVKYPYEDILTG